MERDIVERLREVKRGSGDIRQVAGKAKLIVPYGNMMNDAADRIEALERENASLRSELDEARKALEPFANYQTADGLPDGFLRIPDEHPLLFNGLGNDCTARVTVGDMRRASAIRQKGEADE